MPPKAVASVFSTTSYAGKGYLPQVSLSAKASYQSDVTEIPVDLPGIDIRGIRKDQYQAMLQLDQVVWDGGNIRARKEVTRATSEVDKQKLEVDMYAINERVNQLFFGILLLKEQLKQNQLMQEELQRNYDNVAAYVKNGIANQADLDAVKVFSDLGKDDRREYEGTITWISDKSEFTPKTIQTRDERANLVYATKIAVKNDGYIKIGMYGEMKK